MTDTSRKTDEQLACVKVARHFMEALDELKVDAESIAEAIAERHLFYYRHLLAHLRDESDRMVAEAIFYAVDERRARTDVEEAA